MKKLLVFSCIVCVPYFSFSQAIHAAGGHFCYAQITDISPCDTPGFILTEGQDVRMKYSITGVPDPIMDAITDNFLLTLSGNGRVYTLAFIKDMTLYADYEDTLNMASLVDTGQVQVPEGEYTLLALYGPTQYKSLKHITVKKKVVIDTASQVVKCNELHVYPNPVRNMLYIDGAGIVDSILQVLVFDVVGHMLQLPQSISGQIFSINTSYLSSGVYFARMRISSGIVVKKFIVQH